MQKVNVITHKSSVYHIWGCPYLKHADKNHLQILSDYAVKSGQYRPCKYCGYSKNLPFKAQADKLSRYCEENNYQYQLEKDNLLIQTDISFWKVLYLPYRGKFILLHGNHRPNSSEIHPYSDHMYHRQKDVPMKETLGEYLTYIRRHDQAKKDFHNKLDNLAGRTQITNKKHSKGVTKRVMNLFDMLEKNDPSLKQYSFA